MAERKINRRRLIGIVVWVCALGLMGGAFYAYRMHRIHTGFLAMRDQGLKAADAGQNSLAINLLGAYLARYPNDADALAVYARSCTLLQLPNNENVSKAIWAYRHLLRLDSNRLDARRQLMGLYMNSGYNTEALDEANSILTARDPLLDQIDAARMKHMPAVPSDAALAVAQLQKFPDALEAIGARTNALRHMRRERESLVACDWWIEADPSNVDAALIRVELENQNHRSFEEAMGLGQKWTRNHANPADNDLLIGHINLTYLDFNQAHEKLKSAASGNPSSDLAVRILSSDLDTLREPDLARAVLDRILAKNPKDDAVRFDLVVRDWDSARWSDVIDLTSDFQAGASMPIYIFGLRATALMNLGKTAEVKQALSKLSDRKDDREAEAWMVLIRQLMDPHPDSTQILKACLAGLDQNPHDYYLRYFLAATYAQQGERESAIREWQRVTEETGSWALPPLRLANALLEAGHTEQSLEFARVAFGRSANVDTFGVLLESWVANVQAGHKEDAPELTKILEDEYSKNPHSGGIIVLYSSLLAALGQNQQAVDVVQAALNAPNPLSEQNWIRLASLCGAKHLDDKDHPHLLERSCLARSQKEHGITPALAYAKAVVADNAKAGLASLDADEAAAPPQSATSQPAVGLDGQPADLAQGWDFVRACYLELNHDPAAAAAWVKLADRNPSQLQLQRLMLSADSVKANKELSARCIDRIGQLVGHDSQDWRVARARWLVRFAPFLDSSKQPTPEAVEARTLLDGLISENPSGLEIRLISAQAFELAQNIPAAITELKLASTLNPQAVSIRLTLARLLEQEGDFDAVQEQLDHLTDADLQRTDQRRQAAAMFAQQGQIERAIKLLEEDSAANKESSAAMLMLGRLYLRRGDMETAKACLDKLLASHPDSSTIRFGAELCLAQGETDKAQALLNRLGKDGPADPGVKEMILAEFATRDGSPAGAERAIALLETATKAAPNNPLAWRELVAANLCTGRAEKALDAANAGLRSIPDDPTLKAISGHPAMLTYTAGKPDLLPMLHYFLTDPSSGSAATSALEDIYNDSLTQKSKGGFKNRTRDVLSEQLQQVAEKFPRFEPLQLYLISRYAQQTPPRLDDAISVALAAGRAIPDSVTLAQVTTQLMLDDKRYAEAVAAAERWVAIPHQPKSQYTLAKLQEAEAYHGLNQPKEELDILQPLFEDYLHANSPASDDGIVKKYQEALEATGTKPDLAALMKPLLSQPGKDGRTGRFQWMRFAVNNLPPDEAEGWLVTAGESIPDKSAPAGVLEQVQVAKMYSILGIKTSSPRLAQKARDILSSLAAVENPQAKVLIELGQRLDADGDRDGAATAYRRALHAPLGDQNDHLLAENNLAMDLARTGHASEGLPFIDAAVKTLPKNAELLDSRAFVRFCAGDADGALADMREAAQISSQPRFHLKLAQMLIDTNHRKDAEGELRLLDSMTNRLSPEQNKQLKDLHAKVSVASIETAN